jgi:hypothetical protein
MSQIRAPFEFALRVLHNSEASRDHIRRQVHPTRMEWRLSTDLLAQFSTESYGESAKQAGHRSRYRWRGFQYLAFLPEARVS